MTAVDSDRIPEGTDAFRWTDHGIVYYRPTRAFTVDGIVYDFTNLLFDGPTGHVRPMIQILDDDIDVLSTPADARHRPQPLTEEELDGWIEHGHVPRPVTIPEQRRP